MANLVLTNLDTGQQIVITDTLTLDQAIASVKIVCNNYTDNASSNVLIEAKTYADSAMLSAITNILPTIPVVNYPQNSGAVRLVVGKNADNSLKFFDIRDEKYIQAGDLLALQNSKTFTLAEIANAKLELIANITNSVENAKVVARTYTQEEIARVEALIQAIEMQGFTFETFLEYLDLASDYFYAKRLNSTVDVDGNIQRFHFTNTVNAELDLHNITPITPTVPTTTAISFKDINHNGVCWKYVACHNIEESYLGFFAVRNNITDTEPFFKLGVHTGWVNFLKEAQFESTFNSKSILFDPGGYSGVWNSWDVANFVLQQIDVKLREYGLIT